jgi:hypothetical protein
MVVATAVPNKKRAIKLKKAAITMAFLGAKTLVDITVAMEFAASFMPFPKSYIMARSIITIINSSIVSLSDA